MSYVYYANYYARNMMDKELFISTLQKVLGTSLETTPDLILLIPWPKDRQKNCSPVWENILNRRKNMNRIFVFRISMIGILISLFFLSFAMGDERNMVIKMGTLARREAPG